MKDRPKHTPVRIDQSGDRGLEIEWEDGRRDVLDVVRIRQLCPCASCVDEITGKRTLDPDSVPDTVRPERIFSVGRYALGIEWSDGHSSGIYTFDYLRHMGEMGSGKLKTSV